MVMLTMDFTFRTALKPSLETKGVFCNESLLNIQNVYGE